MLHLFLSSYFKCRGKMCAWVLCNLMYRRHHFIAILNNFFTSIYNNIKNTTGLFAFVQCQSICFSVFAFLIINSRCFFISSYVWGDFSHNNWFNAIGTLIYWRYLLNVNDLVKILSISFSFMAKKFCQTDADNELGISQFYWYGNSYEPNLKW